MKHFFLIILLVLSLQQMSAQLTATGINSL